MTAKRRRQLVNLFWDFFAASYAASITPDQCWLKSVKYSDKLGKKFTKLYSESLVGEPTDAVTVNPKADRRLPKHYAKQKAYLRW